MDQDIHDWDIVVLHGDVKIIGYKPDHPEHEVTLSSPILGIFCEPIHEVQYTSRPPTGEARPLLAATSGSRLRVKSGKTYRLCGPRKDHDGYSVGSIWRVYAEEDTPPSQWQRFLSWLKGSS